MQEHFFVEKGVKKTLNQNAKTVSSLLVELVGQKYKGEVSCEIVRGR